MATRRGVIAFVVLLTVLGALVLLAALRFREPSSSVPGRSVLVYRVPYELHESDPPYRAMSFDALRWRERPVVWDVVDGLRQAAEDDGVKALVLHIEDLGWGWGRLAEVREAVLRFRASGKPVYASLEGGGDPEYYLASAADLVSAPPSATLAIDGLSASAMFLRGSLDKLGVRPNYLHVGEYKSGVETYTRSGMSAESRESLELMLDTQFRLMLAGIGGTRSIGPDSVRRLVDQGPFLAREAFAAGLLDTTLHGAEIDSLAVRRAGRGAAPLLYERWLGRLGLPSVGTRVALVAAEGTIVRGRSRTTATEGWLVGSESLGEVLRQLGRRRSVSAVVLRVDSPGGDAQASDEIWREVERLSRRKPVIVSMSDYAASGGYYIAAGGRRIVAQPSTLTGSIGIYGGKFNILPLMEKLGLNVEVLTRGEHAGMLSPYRDFSAAESTLFQRHLEDFYQGFVAKVAENRGLPVDSVDRIARGRVWTGQDAFERGLVDTLGGLDAAFALVRREAGLAADAPLVVERYPGVERTLFRQLVEGLFGDEEEAVGTIGGLPIPPAMRAWSALAVLPPGRPLAILPFALEIR